MRNDAAGSEGAMAEGQAAWMLLWKYIWKRIRETSAAPLSAPPLPWFLLHPFPSTYFRCLFRGTICPYFFFHFSPSLTHCLSQSVSQWAAPMKRWSTFESAASLKSGHHFLSLSHSCPLFSPLICSSLNSKSALPPSSPPPALLLLYIDILPSFVARTPFLFPAPLVSSLVFDPLSSECSSIGEEAFHVPLLDPDIGLSST